LQLQQGKQLHVEGSQLGIWGRGVLLTRMGELLGTSMETNSDEGVIHARRG
jgi:hypothetical protein